MKLFANKSLKYHFFDCHCLLHTIRHDTAYMLVRNRILSRTTKLSFVSNLMYVNLRRMVRSKLHISTIERHISHSERQSTRKCDGNVYLDRAPCHHHHHHHRRHHDHNNRQTTPSHPMLDTYGCIKGNHSYTEHISCV